MYSIYSDDICIHEDIYALPEYKVIGAKLTLEENAAGSLTLTIPPKNIGYNIVKRMSSVISVRRDGEEIWSGRVVDEKEDFWKRRQLTCEGELGYLNDSIQPPAEYVSLTVRGFLEKALSVHNASVETNKRFQLGAVTQTESGKSFTWRTNYENTMQCVAKKLVETFGGRVRVRKVNGVRYLDYLAEYPNTNSQIVEFGKNLLDFTKSWDLTELVTVVIPRGKKLEKSPIKDMEAYTTVESVNNGSIKVIADTVNQFGYIELVVDWPDISDPAQLLKKAKEYLTESQFETMVLEVSMVDLHLMSGSEEPVDILDQLRCRSYLHGMDTVFPVTKIVMPLDHPEQTEYTLGKSERMGLAESSKKTSSDILAKIDALPTKESILTEAKENADAIINMATNGYITITKGANGTNELYISDTQDYKAATRYWRWNLNGLAYYDKSKDRLPKIAMTMDGAIVADFVTTGTMSADRIRTGILESINKNTVFNLNTGELTMRKGSIYIGKDKDGQDIFSVDSEGNLYARRGTFAGTLVAAKGTFAGDLQAVGGTFTGNLSAVGGTFKGELSAASGTFTGDLSAAGGTFKGNLSAAGGTFKGELSAASGTFTGNLSAAGGTFKGELSAASGTFAGNLSAAGGTFKGNLSAAGGTFTGDLSAAGGTFKGRLSAATGTFAGDISAASGTFTGTVKAARFLDLSGNDMMSSGKFKADYLDLYGLTITNKRTGEITFGVDAYGAITINGNITMGSGSTINWATVGNTNLAYNPAYSLAETANIQANRANSLAADAYDAADAAYARANAAYREATSVSFPSYIRSTYIDQTTIRSPVIEGGEFFGGEFNVIADGNMGSFNLYAGYDRRRYCMFTIDYYEGQAPTVELYSPASAEIIIGSNYIVSFKGRVDFSRANVTGL